MPEIANELMGAASVSVDAASNVPVDVVVSAGSNCPSRVNLSEHRTEAVEEVPSPTVVSAPAHRSGAMQGVEAIRRLQG